MVSETHLSCDTVGRELWLAILIHLSMSSPKGEGRATHGNLTVTYTSRVGILIRHHTLHLQISNSRREVNHLFLLILTVIVCRGWGF